METIYGKRSLRIDADTLEARMRPYREVLVDIGTGDGRFVHSVAKQQPSCFVVGIDACREQLRLVSRTELPNAVFLIANALALPRELAQVADRVTINFPWGSLLTGLVDGSPRLFDGLAMLMRSGASLEVRLNAGALVEAGLRLEEGGAVVKQRLLDHGFDVDDFRMLDAAALRRFPTSWAKRLAFGRDARALMLRAKRLSTYQAALLEGTTLRPDGAR